MILLTLDTAVPGVPWGHALSQYIPDLRAKLPSNSITRTNIILSLPLFCQHTVGFLLDCVMLCLVNIIK
jgi:hypothetical protein